MSSKVLVSAAKTDTPAVSLGEGVVDSLSLSDDEDTDGWEVFDAFDPFARLVEEDTHEDRNGAHVGDGARGSSTGGETSGQDEGKRERTYDEREGAAAIVEVGEANDARAKRLEAEERNHALPLDGMSFEQISELEIKLEAQDGVGTLSSTSKADSYDGIVLKEPLRLASARALEGYTLRILPKSDAASTAMETATIQSYDAAKRQLLFAQAVSWRPGKGVRTGVERDVRFQIPARVESQLRLKGMKVLKQAEKAHWALGKSPQDYLAEAIRRCLEVSRENMSLRLLSMGTYDVRIVLQVTSYKQAQGIKEAIEKQVLNGNVMAVAKQAVKSDHAKVLESMKLSVLYSDAGFPAEASSIWGPNWRADIDERIRIGVEWVRPEDLLRKMQERKEILKNSLQKFLADGATPLKFSESNEGMRALPAGLEGEKGVESIQRAPSQEDVALGIKRLPSRDSFKRTSSGKDKVGSLNQGEKARENAGPVLMLIGAGGNDVTEGKGVIGVGHRSFVAAVWMLAVRKDFAALIRGLFVGPAFTLRVKYGVHSVKLFVRGKWRVYTVDDMLPVDNEVNMIFSSATEVQVVCCLVAELVFKGDLLY